MKKKKNISKFFSKFSKCFYIKKKSKKCNKKIQLKKFDFFKKRHLIHFEKSL
ncbi:50S ribosomal protein L33 [Candidatus Nasuia deltocephalinicola]|uniref:50S ribosomal protein L33 n=1 Tax=Candidatus Nasuia deltocephalincola TaxID=1160784 RepID=UPI00216AE9E6|nr:50S ribosomal protein L33 [Candidatus Nasuia deltocephalinicola]